MAVGRNDPVMMNRFLCARRILLSGMGVITLASGGCDAPLDASAEESDTENDPATLDVDERFDVPEGTELAWVDFGAGPIKLAYEIENGEAIWQGDIILGDAQDIAQASDDYESDPEETEFRSAIAHLGSWPDGVIPYEVDVTGAMSDAVQVAIDDWNSQTVVRLVPRNPHNPLERYVRFTTDGAKSGVCSSSLGMQPGFGAQDIRLGSGCREGQIRHEIGHAVGLFHEHGRADRDDDITVNWSNILWSKKPQYYTYLLSGAVGLDFGPYDLSSVMHYGSFASSVHAINPSVPVMVRSGCSPTSTSDACTFSARRTLSDWDIAGVTRQVTGAPGKFRLRNQNTGDCLRPVGAGRTVGTRVHQSSCTNSASRRWYTWQPPGNNARVIVNERSRHCLGADEDDDLVLVPCTGDSDHRYSFAPSGLGNGERIVRGGTECLRASSTGDGAFLSSSCSNSSSRRWYRD